MDHALPLNATWLRNRIAELGLRQWWLAEQLGVDRRTVLRWVNGQVRTIAPERAEALARVLGCPVGEMQLHEPATQLASADDQRRAGHALAAGALLDRLGPVGEWDVAEQLIRAAAVPDLPVHVLGRLLHQLSVACWRQDKRAEAQARNDEALALALRCGDRALHADVLGTRANLAFWRGDATAAVAAWHEALALARWLTPRQRGGLHSNLGASLAEMGDPQAGRRELRQALRCFDDEGTPMNRAIAHAHLALIALQAEPADTAEAALRNAAARAESERGGYRRGLALARLVDGMLRAHDGDDAGAAASVQGALEAFAAQGIDESLNHRLAARAWRLLGRRDAALAAATRALQCAQGWPFEQGPAEAEQARAQALPRA